MVNEKILSSYEEAWELCASLVGRSWRRSHGLFAIVGRIGVELFLFVTIFTRNIPTAKGYN